MNLLKTVVDDLNEILKKNGIDEAVDIRISNIDNYDYQINNLVKHQNHPNVDSIKEEISTSLNSSGLINIFDFAKNLFINIQINAESIIGNLEDVKNNILNDKKESVIIDYGGPNIGKPLHVGHLRPLNIGRSIYLTNKIIGNDIKSDIHLGDWGMPVAQIITYCELEEISFDELTINMLEEIYPNASKKYSSDDNFKEKSQETNKKLSSGEKEVFSDWKKISELTLTSLKETLLILNHDFDYWWGESSVNELIPDMLQNLENEGKIEKDGGAFISSQITDPRILITKSDGSYLYITTDLATALLRNKEISHEKVLYVTDNRQKLHFEQLFESLSFFDFPTKEYAHVGFGTINDSNGNPLKTRDGGNLKLVDLYEQAYNYIQKINSTLSEADLHCLTNTVLTYSDLITNRKTDYKFDLEKFTSVSGKTGIYVQYAQVRANKLVKTLSKDRPSLPITPTPLGSLDRNLVINLANIEFHLELSIKNNEPHHLANYLYTISNAFNAFYQDSNIKKIEDTNERNQKILITTLFIEYSHLVMSCLGITPVNKM
ncbi:arginine--tRNA ligase [Acidimicrobiia bacterium]|jgi:arginyl-tRNA synthetase|nr:arginine--tRNA ligase [Acidimicrobiia bacterium]MDC3374903.1 arginine--tRNA ligase [Acidimicrobiia bacterium]